MGYEEIMAAIKDINGPWSNAACMGYCRMAMKSVGVDEKTQNDVLRELHFLHGHSQRRRSSGGGLRWTVI